MCGICGALALDGQAVEQGIIENMVNAVRHRGPDDFGVEIHGACGIGNARLAILDLSEAGHLPMRIEGQGRPVWIAYNGEAYNYAEIRPALEVRGYRFRSGNDTETLLAAYLEYGDDFLERFRGMFALAIWDPQMGKLTLARDRLGQKPLYYYHDERWFVFGSEIKSLLQHPAVPSRVNEAMLPYYLAYGYAPTPQTMFDGIKMLPPGKLLTMQLDGSGGVEMAVRAYWEAPYPSSNHAGVDERALTGELLEQLREAVRLRLISDVPLGAFLSGGLDSSAIVALMAEASTEPVKTFAIGFAGEESFDERAHARKVAKLFATDHREFVVEPNAIELLPELVWHYDQPFADSSAIPTYLVAKHTRQYVTVALTGDGGDELFAGYDRFRAAHMAERYSRLPAPLHSLLRGTLGMLPESTAYRGFARSANRFVAAARLPLEERYLSWVRVVSDEWLAALLDDGRAQAVRMHYAAYFEGQRNGDLTARLLDVNMRTYLPDDLLIKIDRMSMAVSLEARAPFLDHNLVEFMAGVPSNLKLRGSTSKHILKQALRGILPDEIIERRKHGFGVPVGRWFRNELADFAQDVLLAPRALQRGYFAEEAVRGIFNAHLSGRRDLGPMLWSLLTFELWVQRFIDEGVGVSVR